LCLSAPVVSVTAWLQVVVVLCVMLQGGGVLEYTDGFILFSFLTVFTVATIFQCFMFSVFFSRANLAAACAAIFYFIGYLPYALVVQWEEYMRNWHKSLAVSCHDTYCDIRCYGLFCS